MWITFPSKIFQIFLPNFRFFKVEEVSIMDRVILHSDMNSCYASIELLHHPELRGKPLAVGGDPEARHGIVLAKDEIAKK
jgi:hypothetical protein